MKTKLPVVGFALLLLPCAALAWTGDTWGNTTHAAIKATADQMIDSTWVPKGTFQVWQYSGTYCTYTAGHTYTGISYCQSNPQENWPEFTNYVNTITSGTAYIGNDCSGFVSICWKLTTRYVCLGFESGLGTHWISLGDIGSAATTPLVMCDALNWPTEHILMFLNYETSGIRTMEQTPNNAQRRVRLYTDLTTYRPIRRLQLGDVPTLPVDGLSRVVDVGNAVSLSVSASGTAPLAYRWSFNGNTLSGATTSQLTFTAAQSTNAGNYVCVVTNAFGSVTSRVMSLTVYPAQTTVFLDTFDTNSASKWQVNKSSTDTRAIFNYDYSGMGIPAAPHSTGGTTRGLRMEANLTAGAVAALSLSPTNQSFGGNCRLRFDLWLNMNGPLPGGGAGSTEHLTAGIGTAGNRVQWTGTGSTADGCWFAADGDGGAADTSTTAGDFCAYVGASLQGSVTGVYAAGTNSTVKGNNDAYYLAAFPTGLPAPALQQANYAQQTGTLAAGTLGFAWHEVIVARHASTVDWAIDGIKLATITNATLTASNVFVGYWDTSASLSDNTNLSFGLVDNVRVEVPSAAPVTTTVLTGTGSPTDYGTAVTFTATVTGDSPTGTVQFQDGSVNLGSPVALSGGRAQLAISTLCCGSSHSITATYSGDESNFGSTSSALLQTINTIASATLLSSSLNPSTAGSNVTFTATVRAAAGTPAGNVVFLANNTPFSTNALDGGGVAQASTASLPAGTNTIAAQYAAQGNYQASNKSRTQVVATSVPGSQTNVIAGVARDTNGTFTLTFQGTPGVGYYVVASPSVAAAMNTWTPVPGSTNTAPSPSGQWSLIVTDAAPRYYRLSNQ